MRYTGPIKSDEPPHLGSALGVLRLEKQDNNAKAQGRRENWHGQASCPCQFSLRPCFLHRSLVFSKLCQTNRPKSFPCCAKTGHWWKIVTEISWTLTLPQLLCNRYSLFQNEKWNYGMWVLHHDLYADIILFITSHHNCISTIGRRKMWQCIYLFIVHRTAWKPRASHWVLVLEITYTNLAHK